MEIEAVKVGDDEGLVGGLGLPNHHIGEHDSNSR
jgi:hypothetical protein